jgi:pimeloyl-ACP methyl ester carboxylesterase
MPYSLHQGVKTYYETAGEGPAMLLVHANTTDHHLFLYQIAHFSTWFKVVAPDLRGWGRTRATDAAYGIKDLCGDMIKVCETEGVTQAIVMGVSVGSKISLHLGLDRPDLVRAVIAVGGSASPAARTSESAVRYRSQGIEKAHPPHLDSTVTEGFRKSAIGTYLLSGVIERSKVGKWTTDGAARTMEAAGDGDIRPQLKSMKPPVLVINGEFDNSRPRGEETAKLVPGARHVLLTGLGHCCNIEDPAVFDAAVIAFLTDKGLMPKL